MRRSIIVAAICVCLVSLAHAAESKASMRRPTTIPAAQELGAALQALARDRDLQLLYRSEVIGGLRTKAVSGDLTFDEALKLLLQDTGLTSRYVDEKTVAIVPANMATGALALPANGEGAVTSGEGPLPVRLAQSVDSSAGSQAAADTGSFAAQGDAGITRTGSVPEILVKGSRSLNMDIRRTRDDIQPYAIFDRQTIERSGARNVEDFLRYRLTTETNTLTSGQVVDSGNNSSFNLRGLSSQQTLILVDGHRVASGPQGVQPDLNGVPLAAIERIEVLSTTASGIYGGSATGGVINVVMRRDYTGLETKLTYENSFDGGGAGRRIDMAGGFNFEGGRTSVTFAGTYSDGTELLMRDRDFLKRGRDRILANDPGQLDNSSPPLGATTNISTPKVFDLATYLATGAIVYLPGPDLVLDSGTSLNSSFAHVPAGYAGPASDNGAAFLNAAGSYNLDPADTVQIYGGGKRALVTSPTVQSLKATVRREFTPWLQAFIDLSASKNKGAYANNFLSGTFFLAGSAPANPFQQDVYVTTPMLGTDQTGSQTTSDNRVVGGVIVKLPKDWHAEADYTWNRTRATSSFTSTDLLADATTAVTSGVTSGGAPFNVFGDTRDSGLSFAQFLVNARVSPPIRTTLKDAAIRLGGPIGLSLPAGSPSLTLLAEHRKEVFGDYELIDISYQLHQYEMRQTIGSLYLETLVPLVSARNELPGIKLLELQIAARRDRYENVGSNQAFTYPGAPPLDPPVYSRQTLTSTDPTVGLRFQPISDVTFRASYGTGFLPPSLGLLVPGPTFTGDGAAFGLTDPRRGNESLGVFTYATGGNPNLKPEQSESTSAGIIVTPRFAPGLRLSVDWTRIEKHDNITSFAARQSDIELELLLPGFIIRAPSTDGFEVGPIIAFGPGYVNVARQTVEAMDFGLEYRMQTERLGVFTFNGALTHNRKNATQTLPGFPIVDYAGTTSMLGNRANAALNWDYRSWTALWSTRFYDSYCLSLQCGESLTTVAQGSRTVPRQIYHDLSVGYDFGDAPSSLLSHTDVRLGIKNVFNTHPPVDVTSAPYYSTIADPRISSYYLSLRKSF